MAIQKSRGRVAVIGAGPGGLATTLALHRLGFQVTLYERYHEIKAAGNILNLWPTPQKVLRVLGVDTDDLGAAALTQLRRFDGHKRADFVIPQAVVDEYQGGFIGLLRWGLYKRMLDALPAGALQLDHRCTSIVDRGRDVVISFEGRDDVIADIVVGADGIDSKVRKELWGDAPIRNHDLHLMGGYFFTDEPIGTRGVFAHDRTVQGSYTPIRHEGRNGYEWWVLESWKAGMPFTENIKDRALSLISHFDAPLPGFVRRTDPAHTHRWEIRDRPPLKQWSKGRITLVGDAAHPTSPYAAYGAGMSIEDGYFLGRELQNVDVADLDSVRRALQAFEDRRKPHCARVSQEAWVAGKVFHKTPAFLRPLRDFIMDHTTLMQRVHGDAYPALILAQLAEVEDPPPRRLRPAPASVAVTP
ncbi:FAD-dependent oxidoreductase [Variovorax sp. LT1R16]|uniref:FAD-dependent oxidoreductase n=1 Tax=Variovorax sp. LT1R16 TaxID=3443728 RepID=UPI003F4714E0